MHSAFTIHTMQITQVKHLHRIIRKYTKHYFCYCVPHFPPYFLRVENLGPGLLNCIPMTKYIIGEIFNSGRATLYKNPSDQTVHVHSLAINS